MSYLDKQVASAVVCFSGPLAEDALTALGVHTQTYMVMSEIEVNRLCGFVHTLTALDTISAVVTFKRRPTFGSAAGEETIGTLVFGDALAVGKVVYKDVSPVVCYPGDEIVFEVTTAGTDSGVAAGKAVYGFEYFVRPESAANQSDMVASA